MSLAQFEGAVTHWMCGPVPEQYASNSEIGRIRHPKLNPQVQSEISDFGFEMQGSSDFKILDSRLSDLRHSVIASSPPSTSSFTVHLLLEGASQR
jgi:hypothetical protein